MLYRHLWCRCLDSFLWASDIHTCCIIHICDFLAWIETMLMVQYLMILIVILLRGCLIISSTSIIRLGHQNWSGCPCTRLALTVQHMVYHHQCICHRHCRRVRSLRTRAMGHRNLLWSHLERWLVTRALMIFVRCSKRWCNILFIAKWGSKDVRGIRCLPWGCCGS